MTSYSILLTVDVEDWFQVENLRSCCPVSSWSSHELRVERNTHRILDLLDSRAQKNIRQDQQDEQDGQKESSAFPDEKQKDLLKEKMGASESLIHTREGKLIAEDNYSISQFHPETEKRS